MSTDEVAPLTPEDPTVDQSAWDSLHVFLDGQRITEDPTGTRLTADQIEMANQLHGEGNWYVHERCPANGDKRSVHHNRFHQEWGNTAAGILRQIKDEAE